MYTLLEVCFMCLNNGKNLSFFFDRNDQHQIAEQVKYIFPELVIPEFESPLRICSVCHEKVRCFKNFKEMCYENICQLKSSIHSLNTPADDIKEVEELITEITTLAEEQSDVECIESESDEITTKDDEIKIETEAEESEDPLLLTEEDKQKFECVEIKNELHFDEEQIKKECNKCKAVVTGSNLYEHFESNHPEVLYKNFQCSYCQKEFTTAYLHYKHLKSHSDRKHQCPVCSKLLSCKTRLESHLLTHFSCTICDEKYASKADLTSHMETHQSSTGFVILNRLQ